MSEEDLRAILEQVYNGGWIDGNANTGSFDEYALENDLYRELQELGE